MKRQAFFAVILMIVCLMVTVAFAASFTSTYDTATPLGTDAPSVLDNRIREVKAAVQERLNVEHVFDLTGTEVSHANSGQHTAINCTSVTSTGAISGTTITGTGGLTGTTLTASGNATVGGTLDVTGNIDPTSYETTNGGFLDEDDMASDSATAVASQQSIKKYVDDNTTWSPTIATGYAADESVTFPNGFIFKSGYIADSGNPTTLTFVTAFPTAVVSFTVSTRTSASNSMGVETGINSLTTSSVSLYNNDISVVGWYWMATGY